MCQWYELQPGDQSRCLIEDEDLDRTVQEIFKRAYRFLQEKSGVSVRQDLERATDNLARMYEWDAPEFLIEKAYSVQRQRLRGLRTWARAKAASEQRPAAFRQEFSLIRGDKP